MPEIKARYMSIFFISLIGVYLLGNAYIFWRGAQAVASSPTGFKSVLALLFICGTLSFIVEFFGRGIRLPMEVAHLFHQIGTGWLVFTLYMVIVLLLLDLLKLINFSHPQGFWIAFLLVVSVLGYGYYHYQHPKTEVINLVINKPFNNGKPLTVVAVSDIHLGYGTGKQDLKQYVDMINAQQPDLVLIGGDLIDSQIMPVMEQRMWEELNQIDAPMGIYMAPGNHDYYAGLNDCKDFLNHTSIKLLCDEVITLPSGIQLIGRDDRTNPRHLPFDRLAQQVDTAKLSILLKHQPVHLEEAIRSGIDLQFSGHTHDGQVWPLNLITKRLFQQSAGYRQWDKTHIYVSSGLSLWGPPFRIGTDSELVVFHLSSN